MHLLWTSFALSSLAVYNTHVWALESRSEFLESRNSAYDRNKNGTPFLWILEDDYKGKDFFDHFEFFSDPDPTHGLVRYVRREEAFDRRMAYVQDDGLVIVKADSNTTLRYGEPRASVRINTLKNYDGGLFILDLTTAPWGCGIWPAWWSTAKAPPLPWPSQGEIDIIEGVNDNQHNQVAWHTSNGCHLDTEESFSGNVSLKGEFNTPATNCSSGSPTSGCSITQWSRASYGPFFDQQGGGAFAMKWDENGIAVWSFYRAAIPHDITAGTPNPSTWGPPSAALGTGKCDIGGYFKNHTIIINITFCGDWAGNTYATTACPGTCVDRVMDPVNFANATWGINSMKAYRKLPIHAEVGESSRGMPSTSTTRWIWMGSLAALTTIFATACLL